MRSSERQILVTAIVLTQQVATPIALEEIGFRPSKHLPEYMEWALLLDGVEIEYSASADGFDMWHLTATGNSTRTALFDARILPAGKRGECSCRCSKCTGGYACSLPTRTGSRGNLWTLSGTESKPEDRATLGSTWTGRSFDCEFEMDCGATWGFVGAQPVSFALDDGLLRISIAGFPMDVLLTATLWGRVPFLLADLLAIPPHERRGRLIGVEQMLGLLFGRHPVLWCGLADDHQ